MRRTNDLCSETLAVLVALGLAGGLWSASPRQARACGGFFCQSQPVDQAGENIAFFWNDDGSIEAHVQIFYQGTAESFAWILPVPSVPELDVGTDALFAALGPATAPQFTSDFVTTGTCRPEPTCDLDLNTVFEGSGPPRSGAADAGGGPTSDVNVVARANVGPYETVTLSAGDGAALLTWLRDNGYDIPEASLPAIMHYVSGGFYFVALRLLKNRDVGDIQPIVLRYAAGEPCIPIVLTRIAATPDMPITVYAFASQGVRSSNYVMATPDLDDPGLWMGGARYVDKVTHAVDEAGGRAFVTDYVGLPPRVWIELPSVEELRGETDPKRFMQRLVELGFRGDSQLRGKLEQYLPPPAGTDGTWFYNCLAGGWCNDFDAYLESRRFDLEGLALDIERTIVAPRRRAQHLVGAYPKLSRLFTTMSPEEMTEDPMFVRSAAVADKSREHRATLTTRCGPAYFSWTAPQDLTLPSGRTVRVREGVPYTGSDVAFCEDYRSGDFTPWATPERVRAAAERRAAMPTAVGGGAVCSAGSVGPRPVAGGLAGVAGGALTLLVAAGAVAARALRRGRRAVR